MRCAMSPIYRITECSCIIGACDGRVEFGTLQVTLSYAGKLYQCQ